MKKITAAALTLLVMINTVSCVQTPDNIKNADKGNNAPVAEAVEWEYIAVKDIGAASEDALSMEYGGLDVSPDITIEQPESVCEMTFIQRSGFVDNYKDIYAHYFGEDLTADISFETQKDQNGKIISYDFTDENAGAYGAVTDTGFITLISKNGMEETFGGEPVRLYRKGRNGWSNDSYPLTDGECTVSHAAEVIQNAIDEYYKQYEPLYSFKISEIAVRKKGDKNGFRAVVEKSYKGVPLWSTFSIVDDDTDNMWTIGYLPYLHYTSDVTVCMYQTDTIDVISNHTGMIVPDEEKQLSEIISLESVLKYCSKQFNLHDDMEIENISLKYTIDPVYTDDDTAAATSGNGVDTHCANRRYRSRPVWEIDIANPVETQDIRKYIMIDAVTGECEFDLDGIIRM